MLMKWLAFGIFYIFQLIEFLLIKLRKIQKFFNVNRLSKNFKITVIMPFNVFNTYKMEKLKIWLQKKNKNIKLVFVTRCCSSGCIIIIIDLLKKIILLCENFVLFVLGQHAVRESVLVLYISCIVRILIIIAWME